VVFYFPDLFLRVGAKHLAKLGKKDEMRLKQTFELDSKKGFKLPIGFAFSSTDYDVLLC
jgi:hypothetical protein